MQSGTITKLKAGQGKGSTKKRWDGRDWFLERMYIFLWFRPDFSLYFNLFTFV